MAAARPDVYTIASGASLYAGMASEAPPPPPPPPPPAQSITLTALAGLSATAGGASLGFSAQVTNPTGLPLSFVTEAASGPAPTGGSSSWNTGDLNKAISLAWAAAGTSVIRVRDANNALSNSLNVTVAAAPTPPPPSPSPSPAPADRIVQFLTHDGDQVSSGPISSPNRNMWNALLGLRWKRGYNGALSNSGLGDWLDSAGVEQGTTAYASTVAIAVTGQRLTASVTTLVAKWLRTGETKGFYLSTRANNFPVVLVGRLDPTPADRPVLTVLTTLRDDAGVLTQQTWDVPARCNASWATSTFLSSATGLQWTVAQADQRAILHFDIEAASVRGVVVSATLAFTVKSNERTGAIFDVFEADPPRFTVPDAVALPVGGLANGYASFTGMKTSGNAAIVFMDDFESPSPMDSGFKRDSGAAYSPQRTFNAATGTTYARAEILADEHLGLDARINVVTGTGPQGQPNTTYDSLHCQYWMALDANFGSSIDATKLPAGTNAQMGYWNNVGYWETNRTGGNGGTPATGLKTFLSDLGKWGYSGHSTRMQGAQAPADQSAYADLVGLFMYPYHLDQGGPFPPSELFNYIVIRKSAVPKFYCFDWFQQMNTMSGAQDVDGNYATANPDGILRVKINGHLAFERTTFRWRRHPEMGVQGAWLDAYHGGTQPAPTTMHLYMDRVGIATQEIGPTLQRPSWRKAMAVNTWAEVPASNTLSDLDPTADRPGKPRIAPLNADWVDRGFTAGALAWIGGAWDEDGGNFWIPITGGHTDYGGNEPWRINLLAESPAWLMVRNPSGCPPEAPLVTRDGKEDLGVYADGRLRAQHTYNNCIYVPSRGPLVTRGSSMHYTGDGNPRKAYRLSERTGEAHLFTDYSAIGISQSRSIGSAGYDASRRSLWLTGHGTGQRILQVNIDTGAYVDRGSHTQMQTSDAMVFSTTLDALVGGINGGTALRVWPITASGDLVSTAPALSGGLSAGFGVTSSTDGYGACWAEGVGGPSGSFCVYQQRTSHFAEISIYTPTGIATAPWVKSVLAVNPANTVTPPASPQDGLFNRFWHSKRLGGFCWLPSTATRPYFFATE